MALTPPDLERCQAEVPTGGPFEMGGPPGDPRNGYRRRCDNPPVYIVTENNPGEDGQAGSMTLCESCREAFVKQVPNAGEGYTIKRIDEPTVHVLHEGLPLCRFSDKVPGEWPEGHTWIAVPKDSNCELDITPVNCERCRSVLLTGEGAEGSIQTDLFQEDGTINGSELASIIMGDTFSGEPIDPDWFSRIRPENQRAIAHAVGNALTTGMLMGSKGMVPDAEAIRALGQRSPTTIKAVARMIQHVKERTH